MEKNNQNFLGGLSPEDILARREMAGGVQFDDPFIPESFDDPSLNPDGMMNDNPLVSEALKNELMGNVFSQPSSISSEKPITSLGKAETLQTPPPPPPPLQKTPEFSPGLEVGWKNLPLGIIPSRGNFYPEGTKIAIRPTETKEIRHYSSIDEDDLLDLNEKLNFIIEKCSIMNFPNEGVVSYQDLKQEDRFFIIMAIRDLTFLQGENRVILTPKTSCENKNLCPINTGVELRTGILSSYDIDSKVMKYYSPVTRGFTFPVRKIGKEIQMYVPSIGVTNAISKFVSNSISRGIEVDDSFIKIAPFLFEDWKNLDDRKIMQKMIESEEWSKEEFSLYYELSNLIKIGTKLDVKLNCPTCGAEVTAPITFPKGFRSLFVISDIFGELL